MNDNLKKLINIWNIISFILLIISFITFGAWSYGIIDVVRMAVVTTGIMIMQATVLLIRILSIRNQIKNGDYSWIESGVIIPRSKLSNVNVKSGEGLFPKGITPTNINHMKRCVFRLFVEIEDFPEEPMMYLDRTYRLQSNTMTFNSGKNLIKGHLYAFDIPAISGEILNFRLSQSGIIKTFTLEELYIP